MHPRSDAAIAGGGVHTLPIVALPARGGVLSEGRGAGMVTAKVGGRTTWKCSLEQSS